MNEMNDPFCSCFRTHFSSSLFLLPSSSSSIGITIRITSLLLFTSSFFILLHTLTHIKKMKGLLKGLKFMSQMFGIPFLSPSFLLPFSFLSPPTLFLLTQYSSYAFFFFFFFCQKMRKNLKCRLAFPLMSSMLPTLAWMVPLLILLAGYFLLYYFLLHFLLSFPFL